MDIYLIRHTSVDVPKGLCYGQSNVPLAKTFEEEAKVIQKKFPLTQVDFDLHSSPLSRCTHLMEFLFPEKVFQTDKRWMEMNFGNWEMKLWNDIPEEESQPWMQDFVNVPTPNGESFSQMIERVKAVWETTLQETTNDKIIVCHGGILRTILHLILEIPAQKVFAVDIDYGAVIKIQYQYGFFKVKFL